MAQGATDAALTAAQEVLKADPNNAEGHMIAAHAHADTGDYETALAECTRALAVNPLLPGARYILGVIYQRLLPKVDGGLVIQSAATNDFNTIDPAVTQDDSGNLWLAFGSFWSGIKLIQLDPRTGKRLAPDSKLFSLAYNESIEASYLCRHDDYYYLFVNWGSCCQGPKSTYNIRIGRSKSVTGPYLDKAGVDMLHSGGSLFLATTNGPLIGPGHAGTLSAQGKDWFTSDFEGDLRMDGRATLAIMPLRWNADGWPEATVNDVKRDRPADSPTK